MMTTFEATGDERTIEFKVTTTEKVTSFNGTLFAPNYCLARIRNGDIITVGLDKMDRSGFGVQDPNGPDGAELNVSFGGGELTAENLAKLPKIVQDAITAISAAMKA